jgi:hypothetical protein
MWFGIFLIVCVAIIVSDTLKDPQFRKKLDEVEE